MAQKLEIIPTSMREISYLLPSGDMLSSLAHILYFSVLLLSGNSLNRRWQRFVHREADRPIRALLPNRTEQGYS